MIKNNPPPIFKMYKFKDFLLEKVSSSNLKDILKDKDVNVGPEFEFYHPEESISFLSLIHI